ncbi:uncharacterized protein BCR38DRAFT_472653 [Pseudomassariella vexata]|uniref:Uncharacterized protein n=1 Tax=Pseudomassariella vexata TaxID=1141098 RepID=A0A1Y2E6J1_9PEZI|nr:uncharacterized protein BCR38DRAFT_472653 [Pseudomassariella vexata]ORY67180.1 hypothetical protein BCR38DRAFT_472653 [Pseudomassariella vexata]
MPIFDARDMIAFPNGDNTTDTVIGGIHFNTTVLDFFNFTLYDNGTLSNDSRCILTFEPYTPHLLFPNGSFVNNTSCYSAINPIGSRGIVGIIVACLFGLSLITVLVNLTKHGRRHLPAEKRFYPIGRRWQWYWAIFVCAAAIIGLFTGIDVDRFYLPELPLVLNVFFWFLMQMGTMALVWEAVRHWGSWMERQYIDPNPFVLQQTDKRGMFEFWLPLFFYLWLWLNFFLIVPRNWGNIELQRSPEQTLEFAIPTATDNRFKAAAFCLLICWLTTAVSLWHSIRHYEARNRGFFNRMVGGLGYMPFRFALIMPLGLSVVAYQALSAWKFDYSPLKVGTNLVAMYIGGYLPSFLIIVIQVVSGFLRQNEDLNLIRQRRMRGQELDQELGIAKKPAWWRRANGDVSTGNMRDVIMRNVREVGGGRATHANIEAAAETRAREANDAANATNANGGIEMSELGRTNSAASSVRTTGSRPPAYTRYGGKSEARRTEHAVQTVAGLLFPNATPPNQPATQPATQRGRDTAMSEDRPTNDRSQSTASGTSMTAPPMQIRSMLDV